MRRMTIKVLKESESELIVYRNGEVDTIPNEPYTKVRKLYFNDKRILYDFVPGVSAQETFNDRIFNLMYDKYRLVVRNEHSNELCAAIKEHFDTGDYSKFKDMFVRIYSEDHANEFAEKFIRQLSPYIKIEKKYFKHNNGEPKLPVYVIGNSFAIDSTRDAVSYFHREDENAWQFLCTVVSGKNQSYRVPFDDLGWITIDKVTSNIISKIVFFLNPVKKDGVFMRQVQRSAPKLFSAIQAGTHLEYYKNRMNDPLDYNKVSVIDDSKGLAENDAQ
jgi:hypothetical protein